MWRVEDREAVNTVAVSVGWNSQGWWCSVTASCVTMLLLRKVQDPIFFCGNRGDGMGFSICWDGRHRRLVAALAPLAAYK